MQTTTTPVTNRLTLAAFVVALSHLMLEFSNNFLPIIYPMLRAELGLSYQQVGTIALAGATAGAITQPIFGYLSDRWDPRWIVALSIAWIGLFMGLVGFQPTYGLVMLFVALGGIGSAAYHPAGASLAAEASRNLKGAAVSIFSVGGNLGSALSPLLVGAFLLAVGLRGTAVLIPVGFTFALIFFLYFRNFELERNDPVTRGQRKVVRGPWLALILVITAVATRSWVQGAFSNFLPEWLQSNGASPEFAAGMLSLLAVSISVGSLSGGTISDRLGRAPIVLVSLLLMVPLQALFLWSSGAWQIAALMGMGVMIGASFPVAILMGQEAWPQATGLAASLVIGLGWLPAGMGAWTVGFLADQRSLTFALSTLVLVPLLGALAAFFFLRHYER